MPPNAEPRMGTMRTRISFSPTVVANVWPICSACGSPSGVCSIFPRMYSATHVPNSPYSTRNTSPNGGHGVSRRECESVEIFRR